MMKKIYLLALLGSMFFLGSCTNEEIVTPELPNQGEGLCSFEAGFQSSNGRTVMEDGKVKWQAGDEIVLFDATSSARFIALAGGTSTMFVLKDGEKALNKNGTYTAFYPADSYDVANRTITVKQVQKAVAGSFDPQAALCMATVTDREYATFSNMCSLLKINVPQVAIDGGAKAMNFSTPSYSVVGGGTLAMDGTLNWNQTIKNFRLEGTFEYGKDYYLVIPPQTIEEGFTLAMNDGNNATVKNCARTKASAVTFEASKSYTMGTIFEVMVDNSWYEDVVEAAPESVEFEVSTPEQFVSFVQMMNGATTRNAGVSFEGKTIKLDGDLDFTFYNDAISPIKNFKGSFDGQGHVIKNLKIVSDEQFVGLFAVLEQGQIFQNLTLQGGKIVSTYNGTGNGYVGSVLGYTYGGTIINCHNLGCEVLGQGPNHVSGILGGCYMNCSPTIIACSNSANVTSDIDKPVYVGGITTRWGGAIRMVASYNVGSIEVKNCTQPYAYAGGLSGDFGGTNYMYGCFNSGLVKGVNYIGSLAGASSYSAYIYNSCYADGEGLQDIGNEIGGANKYNVSRCSYADAVNILNLGIEYYNQKEVISCEYRFVAGSKPTLEKVNGEDGIGIPGLDEGEIF